MNKLVLILIMPFLCCYARESFSEVHVYKDIQYEIVEDEKMANIKRSVDVVLSRKINKEELKEIAIKIKQSDSKLYEKTFIVYLISEDKNFINEGGKSAGKGAWATTHFNPELEVKILGLSIEDEKSLTEKAKSSSGANRKIIGSWIDDRIHYTATLFIEDKKLFMERLFSDGSGGIDEMIIGKDKRITEKAGNGHGEYYVINAKKELESWGKNGLFYTAKKISTSK